MSSELAQKVRESFQLNESLLTQFWAFVKNMLSGNFGVSYEYHRPVFSVIGNFLPFTVCFAITSFILQFTAGITLAVYVVRKKHKFVEKIADTLALGIYSVPSFLIGIFLIYVFSLMLNVFPSSDLYSSSFENKDSVQRIFEIMYHLILPVITLSLPGGVIFYKYAKENLKANLDLSYVRFLYSNGIDEKTIFKKHVLRNILPQMISLSGVELSVLLSGALVTEVLFNLPGMGRMTVTAILQRDYPLILASTFVSGVFVILCSLIADSVRGIIDKRIMKEIYS
jgi:peptide/nickel transport system permease protein